MEPPRLVVTTDVVDPVEPAPLDRNVAEELAFAFQAVLAETVEMMDVAVTLVESVPPLKLVTMEFVPELPPSTVQVDHVVPIELEEVVDLVHQDKDVVQDNASATMIVMKEIVETLFNPREPTLACALKDLVELALQVSPAVPTADAQPPHPAQ